MTFDHVQVYAKAYASGIATALGGIALELTQQPIDRQGIEFIPELGWVNIALLVFASFGIVAGVTNKVPAVPPVDIQPGQGDHVA